MPMLECQRCKHDVVCDYAIVEKYKRFWMDLSQDALWSSGCSQSLRDICCIVFLHRDWQGYLTS
jgi:hypothetical protein